MSKIIHFSEFFNAWLYGNGEICGQKGYYKSARVGKSGDFYTSVSTGAFFGYTIAHFLANIVAKLQNNRIAIVEIGAEKGDLIADIAEFFAYFYPQYELDFLTIEPFLELQNLQKECFLKRVGRNLKCDLNLECLKKRDYTHVLFVNNELLDAFACELVFGDSLGFVRVENGAFSLEFKKVDSEILHIAREFNITKGEIPTNVFSFAKEVAQVAQNWLFLGFDYGGIEQRNYFSLRSYFRHNTENLFVQDKDYNKDFFRHFGVADLTYDVNFSLWQKAFLKAGAKELFLCHQNRALVDMGLDKVCSLWIDKFGLESYMRHTSKIRQLITPGSFGERFFGFCYANFTPR